jgi:predicted NBD/HSP70 family sugar kinase
LTSLDVTNILGAKAGMPREEDLETVGHRPGGHDAAENRFSLGANQSGMRVHNERLVLSLVRQHGSLSKSDIARMTRLSAQTVSVIMRALEHDGLLRREAPIRGRVGQPSVPMSLDPEGAFFLGLKLGRRSAELVLTDFVGTVRAMRRKSYLYPAPEPTIAFVLEGIRSVRAALSPQQDRRLAGLGIAMPFELWNWADTVGAPRELMEGWRGLDIRARMQDEFGFPVYLQNDATSACGAELVFGRDRSLRHFVYFYIGAFAGGGVVLDGKLYSGPTGNAGALGSMPVPGPDGRPLQLIDVASIAVLEKALQARGRDAGHLWTSPDEWTGIDDELEAWIGRCAAALAYAIAAACAVIDFEAAVVEGWMPAKVRARLVAAIRSIVGTLDVEGLAPPEVREGSVGIHARALGAATLPLSDRFLVGPQSQAREA